MIYVRRYADDGDTKYDDINGSLFSKVVSSNMDTGTSDWLLSDDRKGWRCNSYREFIIRLLLCTVFY
mgnify:CR=1 FL=1